MPGSIMGERTIQCLRNLIARGIQVIICTGRAIESSSRYYQAIGAQGPMVFFNGAEVADVPNVRIITSTVMSLDVVDFAVDLARSMNIHFHAFFPPQDKPWETLMVEQMSEEALMYQNHTGIVPVVADMKAEITRPGVNGCIKGMFITDQSLHDEIRRRMLDRFGNRIYMVNSYHTFLEVMSADVSKGEGLKTVMDCRGLKPQEVMAFGDEENDLPMFSMAGFSAAPSNAKDTVRQAADFIFGSNTEDGLAVFLEEMFKK